MNGLLPFVVSGLVVGSVYAIAAMGLVVTYRTTGLFNFAHGAVGMGVAYAFYGLRTVLGVPALFAILLSLAVVAPAIGIAIDRLLFRGLQEASQATKIVVTLGLMILIQGTVIAVLGGLPRQVAPFLPTGTFSLGTLFVGYDQLIIVALGAGVLVALTAFFRRSRIGVAMRAVVDSPVLAESAGFSPSRIGMFTWSLGVGLAGFAGILFSPLLGLDAFTLTLLVVQAYAAAILGGLRSLPVTYLGALLLGVTSSVALWVFSDHPNLLNGLQPSFPFLFLFGILVFARRGTFREFGVSSPWAGSIRAHPGHWKLLAVVLALLALVLSDSRVFVLGTTLALACAFLSITALTGTSGLISFTQAGLVGAGAFSYIHLTNAGVPFLLALVIAGLLVAPVGLLIAIPALRLPGLFLALATFGVGQLLDGLVFSSWTWFSGGGDGLRGTRPALLTEDRLYVLFLVGALTLFVIGISTLRRSGLGRALVAFRDSPTAAEVLGINPLWPKASIFAISAFMAGVAGGLYAGLLQVASKTSFGTFTSLLWMAVVVVGGVQSAVGAVLAAFLFAFLPTIFGGGGDPSPWFTPLFGLGAILLAKQPGGLAGLLGRGLPRRLVAVRPRPVTRRRAAVASDA